MSDLFFVEWDDVNLGWLTMEFENEEEAHSFADALDTEDKYAIPGTVTVR